MVVLGTPSLAVKACEDTLPSGLSRIFSIFLSIWDNFLKARVIKRDTAYTALGHTYTKGLSKFSQITAKTAHAYHAIGLKDQVYALGERCVLTSI